MDCEAIAREDIAERYLLDDLSPEQRAEFEQHYFGCDHCFGELQRLAAIRDALRPEPPAETRPGAAARWRWPAVLAVAASAAVVALLVGRHEGVLGPAGPDAAATSDTPLPAPPAEPSASSRAAMLAELARAEPPRYAAPTLRHADGLPEFREGMAAYAQGDYLQAAARLRSATAAAPQRPDAAFFLAAAQLLGGDPAAAAAGFERVIALGETAYRDEAWFYLAKARLARSEVTAARAALIAVIDENGTHAAAARELLQRLDELPEH